MIPSSLKHTCEEIRLLGVQGTLYRLFYECKTRCGFSFRSSSPPLSKSSFPSLSEWQHTAPFLLPGFRAIASQPDSSKYLSQVVPKDMAMSISKRLSALKSGQVLCFSKSDLNFGTPLNWHLNPTKQRSWPCSDIRSLGQYEPTHGDVKITWELNRFTYAYDMALGYLTTRNEDLVALFFSHIQSWHAENPYPKGVNWFSGQELAIRTLSWLFCLHSFRNSPSLTETHFHLLLELIFLHGFHIEKHLAFATYASHNNHLIGEALALYMIGTLFPFFDRAAHWKRKGQNLLLSKKCLNQFYDDGGYCQYSVTYQRLALQYYLWFLGVSRENGDPTPDLSSLWARSYDFLRHFVNHDTGQLPNWGANDGAMLHPWTSCDYSDFRPLLQTLGLLTTQTKPFPAGPWDADAFWFIGPNAFVAPHVPSQEKSTSFLTTGLHVIRHTPRDFIAFRCGTIRDRFGQADQLHVDLWWKGLNIAVDGGSYLYNDEPAIHRYLMGSRSHNTVTVNDRDQMYLHRRFKWLYWTHSTYTRPSDWQMEGSHDGYSKAPFYATHRRCIHSKSPKQTTILDHLTTKRNALLSYDLHWLLSPFDHETVALTDRCLTLKLNTPQGDFFVRILASHPCQFSITTHDISTATPTAFISRYYSQKTPALSLRARCQTVTGCEYQTTFSDHL